MKQETGKECLFSRTNHRTRQTVWRRSIEKDGKGNQCIYTSASAERETMSCLLCPTYRIYIGSDSLFITTREGCEWVYLLYHDDKRQWTSIYYCVSFTDVSILIDCIVEEMEERGWHPSLSSFTPNAEVKHLEDFGEISWRLLLVICDWCYPLQAHMTIPWTIYIFRVYLFSW
jgi:hypothetical protein